MDQRIEPLPPDWEQHNEKQRCWVRDHFTEASRSKYDTLDGKLSLLQTIIDNKWIDPTERWKLQSLGITFGDALQHAFPFEWVLVTDEYGTCPALRYPGSTLVYFVWTVIAKRLERGETMDIRELYEGFCDMTRTRLPKEGLSWKTN